MGSSNLMISKPHDILKRLRNKYKLKWLRISMSNHKFPNLRNLLQAYLNQKLTSDLVCKDFENLPCNCITKCKINGKCIFNGQCRQSVVVYEATCNFCTHQYVGNTQQFLKDRMYGHFQDVRSIVRGRPKSDTFASHMAAHFEDVENKKSFTSTMIRPHVTTRILWQGNAINCNKSFATLRCTLCMQERLEILRRSTSKNQKKLMNSRSEIYGACRHVPRFHRYRVPKTTVCADDRGFSRKDLIDDTDCNIFNISDITLCQNINSEFQFRECTEK